MSDVIQMRKKAVVDRLDKYPRPVQTAVRAMLHRAAIYRSSTRNMYNVKLWATSLLEYAQEGYHNLVLPATTPVSLLENQVGDILPSLAAGDRKALEDGGIATVADQTIYNS